jgi:hypothetical protein
VSEGAFLKGEVEMTAEAMAPAQRGKG